MFDFLTPELIELLSGLIGFLLTLMVLSYLIGDNPLFRIAVHIFVGVSAGYAALVAVFQVIGPQLIRPLVELPWPANGLLLIPLALSLLLLTRLSPRSSALGGVAVAYLVGVGSAVAVGGAVLGTILPQVGAAAEGFSPAHRFDTILFSGVALIGAIATLVYFHFGARRQADGSARRNFVIEIFAWVGRLFVALTLGALFAGTYAAALTSLVERVATLLYFIVGLFS